MRMENRSAMKFRVAILFFATVIDEFLNGKSASTPIDTEKPLLKDLDGEDVDVHTYRSMIGSLMYLTSSRLDIMFAVCACAHFQVTPKVLHLHAVKKIFRYLKGKPHLGLWYPKDSPFNLVAYSDSDYAGASLDRKSTTGAAASCCAQVLWIQNQLLDYRLIIDVISSKLMLFGLTIDVVHLMLLDRRNVIITEATVRQALHLDDADSIDCLPNEEIYVELARMGYEKPSTKLTFYKAFFSTQWKFFIHTSFQCMSTKRTAWNEFSSSMASAVICLATGRKFIFSKRIHLNRKEIAKIDADEDVTLEEVAAEVAKDADAEPAELKEVIKLVTTTKLMTEVVTAAATTMPMDSAARRRRGVVIKDPEKATTPLVIVHSEPKSKDKRKGILVEEPKPLKRQAHIEQDEAYARELEAELNANINWNELIEHVKRKEKQDDTVMRYQALKRKPQTEAQARKNMMVYLKNMAGFKMDFFKGMTYDEIRPIFEKHFNSIVSFLEKIEKELEEEESKKSKSKSETSEEKAAKKQKLDEEVKELKTHLQIVPNDEDDVYTKATPLALKVRVIYYQIHTKHNKPYYKIIRADGTHQLFLSFIRKNELNDRGTLLMGLPDKRQLKFNIHKDDKSLMEAIEKKFDLEEQSLYDRFNSLKIYENEVKSSSSTSPTTQNIAFVSSQNTNSTNESVSDVASVSAASTKVSVYALPNVDTLSDVVINSFFASQSNSPQLDNDDLKQIDANDLEEIDFKWQMAMLTMRARRFRQRIGRNLGANGTTSIGFDMNKETQRRNVPVETSTSNALVSQCDGVGSYDWSFKADEEPTNYALMAFTSSSSSSSDNEVARYSKACTKAYATLQSHYDKLTNDLRKSQFDVLSYKTGLESVEARLVVYQHNDHVFEKDIKGLKLDVMLRDNALVKLRKKFKKAEQERDELKLKLDKFQTSLKNLSKLLASQITNKTGLCYDNQVFNSTVFDIDELISSESDVSMPHSPVHVSDSEDDFEGDPMPTQKAPSFVQTSEHIKTPRPSVKPVEHHIPAENLRKDIPKSKGHRHSRNRKACFVCKSLTHLFKDCDYYETKMVQKPVRNHAIRGNHQHYTRMTHPQPHRHVVPTTLLTRSRLIPLNYARTVDTVVPQTKVQHQRPTNHGVNKAHSPIRRPINLRPSHTHSNFHQKVTTVKTNQINVVKGVKENWIQVSYGLGPQKTLTFLSDVQGNPQHALKDKGVIDSGCSRHMTGNISYLSDFEELNRGYVAFGGNPKGAKITGKGKIRTGKLDFDDVYFVKELKFNLFSQMCDKKNNVLFTNTECSVLSFNFKLPDGIFISQDKYVAENLRKFGLTDGKLTSTPIDTEKPLLKDPDGEDVDVYTYRSMIGSLMYLTSSRPDIMFAVCACARFKVTPKFLHLHPVKRIFRYLKDKPHLGLWYPKDLPFNLVAYSDSDYARASLDRKSTTRGCQFLGCRLISWQCKKQTVVATLLTEAEYVAAASCCTQTNDVVRLQALIDRRKVIITEATVRQALHLDDADSIDCLPNEEIFAELAGMGYEKPSTKLTFYKAFFLTHWKTKYTSLALTQKVFANIRRVGKGFFGVDTSLFERMLVPQQVQVDIDAAVEDEDAVEPTRPTPATTSPPTQELIRSSSQVAPTPPPFPHYSPIAQPSSPPQQQPSQHSQTTDISMDLLNTLLETYTTLTRRLEKKRKLKASVLTQLRKVGTGQRVDTSADIVMDDQGRLEESQAQVYHLDLEHADKVLSMHDDEAEPAELKEPKSKDKGKGILVEEPKPLKRQAHIEQNEAYARELDAELNVNINWNEVIEQVKRKEKQDDTVMRYQALKRKPQTEAQARKNMMVYLKNMAGFKMDFFKGMTYDEIRPIFEKHFNSIVAFLEKREKELEEEESKRKSKTSEEKAAKKQKLDEEVDELKTHLQIVPNDEDDVYMVRNKREKDKIGTKPDENGKRDCATWDGGKTTWGGRVEAMGTIPVSLKVRVVYYQIHTKHNKPYYKIIRADGTHQLFLSFINLLRNFNREDLEMLWKIVQERFASSEPKNFSDEFLLNTLKTMFGKPDVEANVWKNQRGNYGLAKVKSWKLLESCGVQIITFTTTQMIPLVKRRYPLTRFTLDQMLNNVRLEVEEESEVSLELLRL
nr:uncharacterized mitochondrial protein AtMg00810-like [Tanacetum cinerariifolium]